MLKSVTLQFESLNSNISNRFLADSKSVNFSLTTVSMHQNKLFYWFYIHNLSFTLVNVKKIIGRRPSVPRHVKCQYVVNMSITCILKTMPSNG